MCKDCVCDEEQMKRCSIVGHLVGYCCHLCDKYIEGSVCIGQKEKCEFFDNCVAADKDALRCTDNRIRFSCSRYHYKRAGYVVE